MKKVVVLLLIILLLAGCGTQERAFLPVELPEVYAIPEYIPWNDLGVRGETGRFVTQEQALADFDYMWAMLEQNAPFLQLVDGHAEFLGFDYADVVRGALAVRGKLEESESFELAEYLLLLQESFGPLAGRGHLNMVDPNFRSVFLNTAEWVMAVEAPEYGEMRTLWGNLQKVLTTRKVREAYAYLDSVSKENEAQSGGEDSGGAPTGIRMTYARAGRKSIPVIVIPSVMFSTAEQINQAAALLQSYMQDCLEMEHLIIDIRGNGGGNEAVLIDGVLKYLVRERVELSDLLISCGGAFSCFLRGWEPGYFDQDVSLEDADRAEWIEPMKALREQFPVVYADGGVMEPLKNGFKGKAWLLIDGGVGSAAASFTKHCKSAALATLVGSRAGSGGSGQPILLPLPNSGLLVFFEDVVGINGDGTCAAFVGTAPDIDAAGAGALEVCVQQIIMENQKE